MCLSASFINVFAESAGPGVTAKATVNGKSVIVSGNVASTSNQVTIKVLDSAKSNIIYLDQTTCSSSGDFAFNFAMPGNSISGTYYVYVVGKEVTTFDYKKDSTNPEVKISSIDSLTAEVNQGQSYTLPTAVSAKMSDGSNRQVNISWEPSKADTSKAGVVTFAGKVDGYDGLVKLMLTVNAVSVYVPSATTSPVVTPSPTNADIRDAVNEIDKLIKDNSKSKDEKSKAIQGQIQAAMEKVSVLFADEKQTKDGVAVLDAASLDKIIQDITDAAAILSQKVKEGNLNAVVEKAAIIDISKAGVEAVNIQGAFFDKMKSEAVGTVKIKTKDAEILIKPDTISEADRANAKSITIQVSKVSADKVDGVEPVYKKRIGDRIVYNFSMKNDVKAIHEFNSQSPVVVTIPYTLGQGENENDIAVYYIDDKGGFQEVNANPVYNKTTGKVSFTVTHFSKYVIMPKFIIKSFSDVDANYSWSKDAINKMVLVGIINGKSDTAFEPGANVTRAEFVKLLDGIYGIKPDGKSEFKDVSASKWYSPYIAVAEKAGIVKGNGNGNFSPDSPISRQDMCVMIVNAMKAMKKNVDKYDNNVLDKFNDANLFSDYAKDSAAAITGMKIMQGGTDDRFGVKDNTLRAQAAVVMYRLYNIIYK
jgi:hypothetical protein